MNTPVGLRQKTIIINSDLAVCWANSSFYSKIVIKDLISEYKNKICSLPEILHYLDNIDPMIRVNVSIVGMLKYNNLFHAFGFNCGHKLLNSSGDVIYIAGSGMDEFLQIFDAFNIQPREEMNPLQYAVSKLIGVYNHMLCKEISCINSFVNCYGGGYELISYVDGRFQKIDDVTHIVWTANEDEKGQWLLQLPKLIMKYKYHDDVLMIRRGEIIDAPDSSGMVKMDIKRESVHLVSPVYRYLDKKEVNYLRKQDLPSFNSKFVCNYVLKFYQTGKVNSSTLLNYSGSNTNPINFSASKDNIHVRIDEKLIYSIFKVL